MAYYVIHVNGRGEHDPPLAPFEALYDERSSADEEHGDVAVFNRDGDWGVWAFRDGRLYYANENSPFDDHILTGCSRGKVIEIWKLVAAGRKSDVENLPWRASERDE